MRTGSRYYFVRHWRTMFAATALICWVGSALGSQRNESTTDGSRAKLWSALEDLRQFLVDFPMRDTDDPEYHPRRDRELLKRLTRLEAGEFPAVVSMMEEMSKSVPNNHDMTLVLSAWVQKDPTTALTQAFRLPVSTTLVWDAQYAVNLVAKDWMKREPRVATEALRQLVEGPSQRLKDWKPEGKAPASNPRDERQWVLAAILPQMSANDPAETLRWVLNLKESPLRTVALNNLMESDPAIFEKLVPTVMGWLTERGWKDEDIDVISAYIRRSASLRPEETLSFVADNSQISEWSKKRLMKSSMNMYASRDREAAARWIISSPVNLALLDELLLGFISAGQTHGDIPETLFAWASVIQDGEQRFRVQRDILEQWTGGVGAPASVWERGHSDF